MSKPTTRAEARATETPNRWITSPTARAYVYAIVAAVVPLLVLLGVFTTDVAAHVLNIAAALLAVSTTALAARNVPKSRD